MRTFLFSLSNNNVFRNLFFFERSVFERLRVELLRERDLRVVFVLPREAEKDFGTFLTQELPLARADQCRIEYVDFPERRDFWAKALRFFYSYFIYTGTTRMLATMGMRPGEPPGGGNWYLNPIKRLIARTVGRSTFFRKRVIPFLYHCLYPGTEFEHLFSRYQPRLVFVPHLFGEFDQRLLAAATRQGVRSMGMASNWDHFDKYYLPFQAETLLAQSEQIKRFAIRYQSYRPEQVQLVGYPQMDFVIRAGEALTRSQVLERLGFPAASRLILYISGSAYCPDEPEVIEGILGWADQGILGEDVRLVIRPYLAGRGADRAFDQEKYDRFETHPRVRFYRRTFWGNVEQAAYFFSIMRHADAVIGVYTTALLEAAALDRPLIIPMFDGNQQRPFRRSVRRFALREHFREVLDSGAVTLCNNFAELREALRTYLADPARHRADRGRLCQNLLYRTDGKSSERILKALLAQLY